MRPLRTVSALGARPTMVSTRSAPRPARPVRLEDYGYDRDYR